jgi:hypothetical protein
MLNMLDSASGIACLNSLSNFCGAWVTRCFKRSRAWLLTLSVLNNQAHWEQLLSSWQDIQTGQVVDIAVAFADLTLPVEEEGVVAPNEQ